MIESDTTEPVLVTGAAGFIGYHVADRLLRDGCRVVGVDSLNDYYDPGLKRARLARLEGQPRFSFVQADLADGRTFQDRGISAAAANVVIHLAAQAGVRYSLTNPEAYVEANLKGFANLLELCRQRGCRHLLFASSSSVYGANTRLPFRASDNVDHPTSFYAATKKANEAMAHSYAHLFGVPATGMRFFTVYGPWGRPDMAMSLFAAAISGGVPVRLFDGGRHRRDYTYVADVAEVVVRLIDHPPAGLPTWSGDAPDPAASLAPWRVVNVGSGRSVEMSDVVRRLEAALGRRAETRDEPAQPGDLPTTFADIEPLVDLIGYRPGTGLEDGIAAFARWYAEFHR